MDHHGTGLRFAAGSDTGRARTLNEDSAFASSRLIGVADGMGGHAHGEVASATAVAALTALDDRLDADGGTDDALGALAAMVSEAARRLDDEVAQQDDLEGMGTTLTAMLFEGDTVAVAHLGDSRGYLLRDGVLQQLTVDHTLVQSLVDSGRITPEEAAEHPQRSVVVRVLVSGGQFDPDLFRCDVLPGDRLLLCSDGVTGVLGDDELAVAMAPPATLDEVVHRLIALANEGGGPDNITCVVAEVVADGAPEPARYVVGAAAELGPTTQPISLPTEPIPIPAPTRPSLLRRLFGR